MVIRRGATHALFASLAVLAAFDSPRAQSASQEPWPPPGVHRLGPGIVSPRLEWEVKPQYTRDAMRARIEGVVVLEAVVLVDGSVEHVRVVKSLDPEHGLDRAAVDAVKQWRFKPATKDGEAVPVVVTVEMSLRLSSSRPVLEWPSTFAAKGTREGWRERELTASDLQFRIALPPDWEAHTEKRATSIFMGHDRTGARSFVIAKPRPTTMRIDEPLPPDRFEPAVEKLKSLVATRPGEITSIGQVRAGGRLWVWVEARVTSLEAAQAAMPPDVADAMPFETGRLWFFSTTTGSQFVQVGASLLYRRGLSEQEIEEETRRAGADFVRIIERLSITLR